MQKARAKRDARRRAEARRQTTPGKSGAAASAQARLGFTPRPGTQRGVLLGGSRFEGPSGARSTLDLLDLDAAQVSAEGAGELPPTAASAQHPARGGLRRLDLDFLPHGMALNPVQPGAAVWFEKWGPGAAYLEMTQGLRLATLEPLPGHHFYGHGAFNHDASQLFAVETSLDSHVGVISVRDPNAGFRVVGQFPSFGKKPHDCVLLEAGVLVVTNGGGPVGSPDLGSVCFIEVISGKLLERLEVADPRRNAGHVALDSKRNLALVSAPRDGLATTEVGGLSLRVVGSAWHDVVQPEQVCQRMRGESLSVCIDEQNALVWVTNPAGNLLSMWPLRDVAAVRTRELTSARGVSLSLDGAWMCVSSGAGAELTLFNAATQEPLPAQLAASRVFGGSHLYTWAYPASA